MQPTLYLAVMVAAVLAVLAARDRVKSSWRLFAVTQVFGATSVATLTALGGASLGLPQVGVMVLVFAAFVAVAPSDADVTRRSLAAHPVAIALIGYTVVISLFGPRLFAGALDVVSMRPEVVDGFAIATPLGPRSSNITHMAYLSGSFLTAIAVSILFCRKLSAEDFRNAVLTIGILHATFALIDWVGLAVTNERVLEFLRNSNYVMVDQSIGDVKRLSGTLSEPSSYAAFAIPLGVFATEDWLRTRRALSGLTALGLWTATLASTSTTGILALVVYVAILLPRMIIRRGSFGRTISALMVIIGIVIAFFGLGLVQPEAFSGIANFVTGLTVGKVESASSLERQEWAAQGWSAFQASFGFGTGAGSFRSSSIVTAVLGSLGFIGASLMLAFLGQLIYSAFLTGRDPRAVERSAAWAALLLLVPAAVSSPTADPGFVFGMLAGFVMRPRAAGETAPLQSWRPLDSRPGGPPGVSRLAIGFISTHRRAPRR